MENNMAVLFQLRMWVSLWQGTHVLLLAAAWLLLRKEFLVSFLEGTVTSMTTTTMHHKNWKILVFSIHVTKQLPFIYLLFEYWAFIISTSWGHLEVPPLSPDSTFYLVSFNSSWLIDCKNLLSGLTAFFPAWVLFWASWSNHAFLQL